jgi:hypothetical protein
MTTPPPAIQPTIQEIAGRLLARDPPPPLVPAQVFDSALTHWIDAADTPTPVKAVLHLLNDDLGAAHPLAQATEGDPLGDYGHAIVHRREGDYDNARYWFRRIGPLPLLAETYGPDPAAPAAFVERCRAVGRGRDAALEAFQQDELARLLAFVWGASG